MENIAQKIKQHLHVNSEKKIMHIIAAMDHLSLILSEISRADFSGLYYCKSGTAGYIPVSYAFSKDIAVQELNSLEDLFDDNIDCWLDNPESDLIDKKTDFFEKNSFKYHQVIKTKSPAGGKGFLFLCWKSNPQKIVKEMQSCFQQIADVVINVMMTVEGINYADNYSIRLFELTNLFDLPLGEYKFKDFIKEMFRNTHRMLPIDGICLFEYNVKTNKYDISEKISKTKRKDDFYSHLHSIVEKKFNISNFDKISFGHREDISTEFSLSENSVLCFLITPEKFHKYVFVIWTEGNKTFSNSDLELVTIFSQFSHSVLKNAIQISNLKKSKKIIERKSSRLIDIETTAALADMTSGVAHEFNNIIGGVVGRLQLLKMKCSDEKMTEQLEKIENMLMEGAYTIKKIQEYTTSVKSPNLKQVNLKEVIAEVIDDTEREFFKLSLAKRIKLVVDYKIDDTIIEGNFTDLTLCLEKIINNAVEASDNDSTITIKVTDDEKYVRLSVIDTGVGIPRNNKQKVFYPFFTSKVTKSSGLSLSVVHSIVTRLGDKIKIHDNEPKGTIFEIILNRMVTEEDITDTSSQGKSVEFLNILVIDDDREIREVLQDMLSIYGHNVIICRDAYEALEHLENRKFDMMITDLGMPGMSGLELAGIAHNNHPNMPIAMVTGWGTQLNKDEVKNNGIKAVLSKPFHLNEIKNLVEELV